ncbi:DUF4974 domain-containing protein [Mariniphaga sediminis]|uniref:DUF4974 domain-containing protein n=1 Tax=Mariniphaga sediminis TaxID=1628158 RepID=A0A399D129_9BACT|nr:FecR domain-containing protein [Mariniphaga sediminis]RIH64080.1 DUF4974 domain-containing protein [Mariniphaga sediminis]
MNKNHLNISDRQLFNYLNNTADENEIRQVEKWIQESNEHRSYFRKFKKAFEAADSYPLYNSIDVEKKWEELKSSGKKQPAKATVFLRMQPLVKIAASILLILASAYLVYFYSSSAKIIYDYTEAGPVIHLPDSSTIYLQPGAMLTAKKRFNREVHLEGEAFFDISNDPQQPFTVHSNQSQIQVLGTSFNLKSGMEVDVKLYEGKIRFLNQSETIILQPGDEITYNTKTKLTESKQFSDTVTKLQFNGTPFKKVCELLEKKYLYKIQVPQEIAGEEVTGQFKADATISEILHILGSPLEFNYTINNRYITIKTETIKNKSPDENN